MFVVSKFVFEDKSVFKPVVKIISKYSFGIYLIHAAVIDVIKKYFMIDASPIISSAYIFVLSFAVSFVLSFLLGKIKYIRKIVL